MAAAALVRILASSVSFLMLVSATSTLCAADEDYELTVDDENLTVVSIISGNFSVKVTRDWPRVIFNHENDPFSPHFEVSCPKMYVFNDTDGDGIFDPLESDFTIFLDSNHVSWNMTTPERGFSEDFGEYVLVGMSASVHAYVVGDNETLAVPDWADLSFWFFVAEKPLTYDCSGGSYLVSGKTEMRMSFTLEVKVCLDSDGLVLEQLLQGGGTTNIFQLVEGTVTGENSTTEVSGLVDERDEEEDYSHEFMETPYPVQMIRFANEDNVSKAFYLWESETGVADGDTDYTAPINASYFTTGAGLMLHSVLAVNNCTTELSHASTMGIYESGFVGGVRDWIAEYFVPFTAICVVIVGMSLALVLRMRRRQIARGDERSEEEKPDAP